MSQYPRCAGLANVFVSTDPMRTYDGSRVARKETNKRSSYKELCSK